MPIPTFSIIVPIYNVEKYIDDCIEGILNQTYYNFELILVDDGSTDNCGKIVESYAEKDNRIQVIHKENGGIASARQAGIVKATGEYVINVDGDDYIDENALEILYQYIEKTHADVYCYGFKKLYKNGSSIEVPVFNEGLYDTKEGLNAILERTIYDYHKPFYTFGIAPSICSKAIRRDLYTEMQLSVNPKITIGEDLAITTPILFSAKSVYVLHKAFYNYRIVSESSSHKFNENRLEHSALVLKDFEKRNCIDFEKCRLKQQLGAYIVNALFYHLYTYATICDSYDKYKNHIKSIDKIVFKFADYCRFSFKSAREAVLIMIVKRKMWYIIWKIAKKGGRGNG